MSLLQKYFQTPQDTTDFGDNGVGFIFTGVSPTSSSNTSRMEASMSSRLLLVG